MCAKRHASLDGRFPSVVGKISPETPFLQASRKKKNLKGPLFTCFIKVKYEWVKDLSMKTKIVKDLLCSNLKLRVVATSGNGDLKGALSLFILYTSVLFECFTMLTYYSYVKRKKHSHPFICCSPSGESWYIPWLVSDIWMVSQLSLHTSHTSCLRNGKPVAIVSPNTTIQFTCFCRNV